MECSELKRRDVVSVAIRGGVGRNAYICDCKRYGAGEVK